MWKGTKMAITDAAYTFFTFPIAINTGQNRNKFFVFFELAIFHC